MYTHIVNLCQTGLMGAGLASPTGRQSEAWPLLRLLTCDIELRIESRIGTDRWFSKVFIGASNQASAETW